MICDGCIVQGFYPHQCHRVFTRHYVRAKPQDFTCTCDIDEGCAAWDRHRDWASRR